MLSLVLFAALGAAAAFSPPIPPSFDVWASAAQREYINAAARAAASSAYARNRERILTGNAAFVEGRATHWLVANAFADLTAEQFLAHVGVQSPDMLRGGSESVASDAAPPPASVDWEAEGFVPPVQNTGQCDALGMLFTDAVSSAAGIAAGKLFVFNSSMTTTCDSCPCVGCFVSSVYSWAKVAGFTDAFVNCSYTPTLRVPSYISIVANREASLLAALVQQPVLVMADAEGLGLYGGGIISGPSCGSGQTTVLLGTGYGAGAPPGEVEGASGADGPWWRLKNAWSDAWGEKGYVRVARGASNGGGPGGVCGILQNPTYPVVRAV
jgi:hypothetical protein